MNLDIRLSTNIELNKTTVVYRIVMMTDYVLLSGPFWILAPWEFLKHEK